MKGKVVAKHSPTFSSASLTNESSADEYYTSGPGEEPPVSPPVSPVLPHLAGFQASRFLRPPAAPITSLFYPGTSPSMLFLSFDDIQKNVGAALFWSNGAGAPRAMAMPKLAGEPIDLTLISSTTPPASKLSMTMNG